MGVSEKSKSRNSDSAQEFNALIVKYSYTTTPNKTKLRDTDQINRRPLSKSSQPTE